MKKYLSKICLFNKKKDENKKKSERRTADTTAKIDKRNKDQSKASKETDGLSVGQSVDQSINTLKAPSVTEIIAELECPVCKCYVSPPIIQCPNGHFLCEMCRKEVEHCPMCRADIRQSIRCLTMEKMATNLIFDCRFSGDGCGVRIKFADKTAHEKSCPFRPYCCPLRFVIRCGWNGELGHVLDHMASHGVTITTVQLDFNWILQGLNRKGNKYWARQLVCYSQRFLLVLWKTDVVTREPRVQYWMFVFIVADIDKDKRFACRLKMSSNGKLLAGETPVRSIRVSEAEVMSRCFCFDEEIADLFIDIYDSLVVNVKLLRDER